MHIDCRESVGIDLSGIIDEKLVDIRKSIRDTGMDPLILPSDSDDFQITVSFKGSFCLFLLKEILN